MIVLFTFLTFYSAYFDVVKDCGCFGDALKLKPWESFMKDVVLLFILFLFINQKLVKPVFCKQRSKHHNLRQYHLMYVSGSLGTNHLPLIDFRPFKVGANIQKGMEVPEGA
jgi:hypothetical protein